MKRATGIGGVFFRCKDPVKTREWYAKHLGLNVNEYGTSFKWTTAEPAGYTAWCTFKDDTDYFGNSGQEFMINYRVEDLEWLIAELKKEGVEIAGEIDTYDYGKFAHIIDCDGRKVELWEAYDEEYAKMAQ